MKDMFHSVVFQITAYVVDGCGPGLSQALPNAGIALCAESPRYVRRINNC
jgi:hypothetical protein